jgi:hemoglobin
MSQKSLYERLGGYDGITTFANDLLPRLQGDSQLGRFWKNRGDDGIAREKAIAGGLLVCLCRRADVLHRA